LAGKPTPVSSNSAPKKPQLGRKVYKVASTQDTGFRMGGGGAHAHNSW
jgi:hypothetical protein